MGDPIHTAWAVSITLRAACSVVARPLRPYLAFSVIGSVVLWLTPPNLYPPLYLAKAAALCLWNVALAITASRHLGTKLSPLGWLAVAAPAIAAHCLLLHPCTWPWSLLEPLESAFALCSLILSLAMVWALRRGGFGRWLWHGRVLCAYLLLDALNGYATPIYRERVGVAVGISVSLCYLAWMGVWWRSRP